MSEEIPELTPDQALAYWRQVARNLRAMLQQLPSATPAAEQFAQLADDTRDALMAYLVAANAYIGHYTTLISEARPQQPPPAAPVVTEQPAVSGWQPSGGSYVPPSRQATMPGYSSGRW